MRSFRSVLVLPPLVALLLPPAAAAYRVATFDGREIEVEAIARLDDGFVARTEEGPVELPAGSIDFYATFRLNLDGEQGNALAFERGGYLRFEKLEFEDGNVTVELEDSLRFTVPESVIDFRESVLGGSLLELPPDFGAEAAVAKSRSYRGRSALRTNRRTNQRANRRANRRR